MFSGWHTICQSQLECYQRLIFSLHFGILVLVFEQTVDKKIQLGYWMIHSWNLLYICDMWFLRYFYPTSAVSNHFQPANAKGLLTASASSVFDIRKQKTAGVPGTFAEICTWLFQWNFEFGTALWSGRYFTDELKPDSLYRLPSLPEHVPVFPVEGGTSVGEEVHCYTSIHVNRSVSKVQKPSIGKCQKQSHLSNLS